MRLAHLTGTSVTARVAEQCRQGSIRCPSTPSNRSQDSSPPNHDSPTPRTASPGSTPDSAKNTTAQNPTKLHQARTDLQQPRPLQRHRRTRLRPIHQRRQLRRRRQDQHLRLRTRRTTNHRRRVRRPQIGHDTARTRYQVDRTHGRQPSTTLPDPRQPGCQRLPVAAHPNRTAGLPGRGRLKPGPQMIEENGDSLGIDDLDDRVYLGRNDLGEPPRPINWNLLSSDDLEAELLALNTRVVGSVVPMGCRPA